MSKNSIIIFGGSKFIQEVDLQKIDLNRFDILCINRPVLGIPVHYLIAHDDGFRAVHSQQEVQDTLNKGLNPVFLAPKTEFIHETTGWKWKFDIISNEDKLVGFCLYTCSSAVNFAYLRGYKNVYLVGVDLAEDNKPFTHWHGVTNTLPVPTTCAKQAKEYLYRYKKLLNLFQCNPNIAKEWQIPYCDISLLYSPR